MLRVLVDAFPDSAKRFGDAALPLMRHAQAMLIEAMQTQLGAWSYLFCALRAQAF